MKHPIEVHLSQDRRRFCRFITDHFTLCTAINKMFVTYCMKIPHSRLYFVTALNTLLAWLQFSSCFDWRVLPFYAQQQLTKCRHDIKMISLFLALGAGNLLVSCRFPAQSANIVDFSFDLAWICYWEERRTTDSLTLMGRKCIAYFFFSATHLT